MNILAPVSDIMTKELVTALPSTPLSEIQTLLDQHRIHHVPVVHYKKMIGIISKSDLVYFVKGHNKNKGEDENSITCLNDYVAEDIMVTGIAKLEPTDRIDVALEVFKENLFHAIPIVEDDELVGIFTTYDVIKALADGVPNHDNN